ncbi:MAG: hypothetical protein WC367_06585, partial [Methanoregula sp.]
MDVRGGGDQGDFIDDRDISIGDAVKEDIPIIPPRGIVSGIAPDYPVARYRRVLLGGNVRQDKRFFTGPDVIQVDVIEIMIHRGTIVGIPVNIILPDYVITGDTGIPRALGIRADAGFRARYNIIQHKTVSLIPGDAFPAVSPNNIITGYFRGAQAEWPGTDLGILSGRDGIKSKSALSIV